MQTENLRVCSTAHFTSEDNELLTTMAGQAAFRSWVVNIQYGYILVLKALLAAAGIKVARSVKGAEAVFNSPDKISP
ncbi:hypothetical protein [Serratia nevei]|uniref:hypothetical protein n=1 Tax=Serratia nevei TaxID=2703794 RepID=UPI00313C4B81